MEIKLSQVINILVYPIVFLIIIYYIFYWINNNTNLKNILKEDFNKKEKNSLYKNNDFYNKYLDSKEQVNNIEEFVSTFDEDNNDINKKINQYIDEYSKNNKHECNPQITLSNSDKCKKYLQNRYDINKVSYHNIDDNDEFEYLKEKEEDSIFKFGKGSLPNRINLNNYTKQKWENKIKDPNSFEYKNKYKWYNQIDKELEFPDDFNLQTTNDDIINYRSRSPMDILTDYNPEYYNCQRPYYECNTRINKDNVEKNPYNLNQNIMMKELKLKDNYSFNKNLDVIKKKNDYGKNNINPMNIDENLQYKMI